MTSLSDCPKLRQQLQQGPTTPDTQRPPACTRARFSLIRFRSPLLTEYLFLPVLRCFTSRRSLHPPYTFRRGSHHMTGAGLPHSEILGSRFVCQLPEAYRRLPRPSSAPGAKASTLCPYKLQPQKTKMLASTVQFSNNDQAHHQHPTPTHPNHAAEAGCTGPAAPTAQTPPHKTARCPARSEEAVTHGDCSLRTQQCVLHPTRPSPTPFPPHTPGARRTRSRAGSSQAVVDVPPTSTTPHTHGVGLVPGPPAQRPAGRRSLERR